MADSIFKIIWQMGIFLIVAQTILQFKPNDSYEKYIRILSNIMVLAMFVVPLFALFKKDIAGQFQSQIMLYEQQLETINVGVGYHEEDRSKVLLANLEKEIKERLHKNAEEEGLTVAGVRVTGIDSEEEGNYRLESLRILVLLESSQRENKQIRVEPVQIGEESHNEEESGIEEEPETEEDSVRESRLRKEFAGMLGTMEEYVEVRIHD